MAPVLAISVTSFNSFNSYLLNKILNPSHKIIEPEPLIRYGKRLSFKFHKLHCKGTGYCLIGGDYGLWAETQHQCTKFDACVVIQDCVIKEGEETVIGYSPNGQAFEVEARNPEHAKWL